MRLIEKVWQCVAIPIVVAVIGLLWVELALRHFELVEAHERRGIIGYHYSAPEWGFQYRPNGRVIEKWAFNMPTAVTLGFLVVSAAVGSWCKRTLLGASGIVMLCVIHLFAALAFLALTVFIWIDAADVFI